MVIQSLYEAGKREEYYHEYVDTAVVSVALDTTMENRLQSFPFEHCIMKEKKRTVIYFVCAKV